MTAESGKLLSGGRFKAGQSGNPAGRPPSAAKLSAIRERIAKDIGGIVDALVAQAKAGDVAAAKLLIERVVPVLRPSDLPPNVPMSPDGSRADRVRAVVEAVTSGEVTPEQAAGLLDALSGCDTAMDAAKRDDKHERLFGRM
jgi:hypothetical protein